MWKLNFPLFRSFQPGRIFLHFTSLACIYGSLCMYVCVYVFRSTSPACSLQRDKYSRGPGAKRGNYNRKIISLCLRITSSKFRFIFESVDFSVGGFKYETNQLLNSRIVKIYISCQIW